MYFGTELISSGRARIFMMTISVSYENETKNEQCLPFFKENLLINQYFVSGNPCKLLFGYSN